MNQLLNELFALIELTVRRTRAALGSYLAIAVGVLIATTTICGLLLYSESVEVTVLRDTLRRAYGEANFDLLIKGESNRIDTSFYQDLNSYIINQVMS
jgi:hypothetical protein